MQLIRKANDVRSMILLVANLAGACLYVFAASRGGWAVAEERAAGISTTTGEPFIWFLSILPVVPVFLVIDAIWLFVVALHNWVGVRSWLLAALVWLPAILIDFAHH